MYRRCINQKLILYFLLIVVILFCIYQNFLNKSYTTTTTPVHIIHQNLKLKKISIAHYTTLYGIRTDSQSKIFNENLKQICEIFNPEDYALADNVFVSLVDFNRFPNSINGISYRSLHQSQLWIVHSEESPKNSYRTIQMKNITELDDWFNLTSTFKPESDFHVQYRVCARLNLERSEIFNLGISYQTRDWKSSSK
jgi:hypothetical protein